MSDEAWSLSTVLEDALEYGFQLHAYMGIQGALLSINLSQLCHECLRPIDLGLILDLPRWIRWSFDMKVNCL